MVRPVMPVVREDGPNEGRSAEDAGSVPMRGSAGNLARLTYAGLALLALTAAGTWLVWFAQYLDHDRMMKDIRAACARIMPDNMERCADTVIIQRGGVR